ncbi:restriction endonuclease subunit S [Mycoplasma sp. B6188]|uniref:restriction endonuclease subunit S n=1 Tax=Mycoplasma sp. B6188 TaxID=3401673 RepID=UPI003AACEAB6
MQKEKLVPAIRFKGFSEEWEEYKISELSTYKNGESYEAFFVNNGRYNVINLNSFTIGGGLKNSNKFVDICISSPLKKDDVVICLSDVAHGSLLGAAALIPFDNKFVLNQRVGLLRIKSDISPLFFVQSINNKQPYFKYHGAGSSQLNIPKKCVEECTITAPSIVEQHKIGKFMSSLNSLIICSEQNLEKLQTIKQSLLNKMFALHNQKIPEIRFKGFEKKWEKKLIGDIILSIPYKKYINVPSIGGIFPVIQQGNDPISGFANGSPFMNYKNVMIFGDHTLSIYKSNSPFFLASDGVRILQSRNNVPLEFLYRIVEKHLPMSHGYTRHYSILKRQEITMPLCRDEQQKIG